MKKNNKNWRLRVEGVENNKKKKTSDVIWEISMISLRNSKITPKNDFQQQDNG